MEFTGQQQQLGERYQDTILVLTEASLGWPANSASLLQHNSSRQAASASEQTTCCHQGRLHRLECVSVARMPRQDGGLAIPLHAYPVSGSPPLPKHLDLGRVPLGETATHQLQLHSCSGAACDFSVTVLQHNKHFTVSPLSGTLPAHGSAAVTLTFAPTKHTTELLQLQVQLHECGAEPMQVLVSGCSKPGLVQQKVMDAAAAGGAITGEGLAANC